MKRALVTLGEGVGNIIMSLPVVSALQKMNYEVDILLSSIVKGVEDILQGTAKNIHLTKPDAQYDAVVRTYWSKGSSWGCGVEHSPSRSVSVLVEHEIMVNLSALQDLGYHGDVSFPPLSITKDTSKGKYCVICPGYGGRERLYWRRKCWPYWDSFLESLPLDGIILGSSVDRDIEMKENRRFQNLVGTMSLKAACDLVAGATFVVSTDNGLAHVSGVLNVPTFVLFGATSEVKNKPWGKEVRVICASGLTCRPCQMMSEWNTCHEFKCMSQISPELVLEEIKKSGVLEIQNVV